jgi:hypothetical protein
MTAPNSLMHACHDDHLRAWLWGSFAVSGSLMQLPGGVVGRARKGTDWVLSVVAGAKADLWLAQKGGSPLGTFSRARVMRRYHFREGQWNDLQYRFRLLRGQPA